MKQEKEVFMLTPERARSVYHFTEAEKRQDAFLTKQITSVLHAKRDFAIGIFSTIAVFVIIAGLTSYQIKNNFFSPVFTAMSLILGYLYFTSGVRMLGSFIQNSEIGYDPKVNGTHYLVRMGTLSKKNESDGKMYTVRVRLEASLSIDDAVMPKAYYELAKSGERLILASSSKNESVVIAIPERYYNDYLETVPAEDVDFEKYQRHLTEQEVLEIRKQFFTKHQNYSARYNQLYIGALILCIAFMIFFFVVGNNRFASVCMFGAGLMIALLISELCEVKKFEKKLKDPTSMYCIDAIVDKKSSNGSTNRYIAFADLKYHDQIYVSLKNDDYMEYNIGDRVLLVRFGKERPEIFRKA